MAARARPDEVVTSLATPTNAQTVAETPPARTAEAAQTGVVLLPAQALADYVVPVTPAVAKPAS